MRHVSRVYGEKKKIFAIVNSTECSCVALQLLLLLVLAGKKNVFMYFNDSRAYREREKKKVNYSKPTRGLARFNIAYPWFKTCHFTYLRFKTLAAVTHLAQFR